MLNEKISCKCVKCASVQTVKVSSTPKVIKCNSCGRDGALLSIPKSGTAQF